MRKDRLNSFAISRRQLPTRPAGGDDEDAPQEPAGEHLADVEAGHDRLAGAGIVGQEEAQSGLLEHVVVDGNPLVGQRVDLGDLGGEGRIGHVPEGQSLAFGQRPHRRRTGGEIENRGDYLRRLRLSLAEDSPTPSFSIWVQ